MEAAKKHPTVSVPEVMYLGGFSWKQIAVDAAEHGRNLDQQVYNRVGKRQDTKRAPSRSLKGPYGCVSLKSPESLVSLVTHPTAFPTPPQAKKPTRRTSGQTVKEAAKLAKHKRKRKNTHKRATALYAREIEKTKRAKTGKKLKRGKSARAVKAIAEREFGAGTAPSEHTIQEHVAKGSVVKLPTR